MIMRPYKSTDAEYICSWIENEYQFRQWCADRYDQYPINPDMINDYYEKYPCYTYTLIDYSSNAHKDIPIGHLTMRWIDKTEKIMRIGFVIVDNKKRNQGVGKTLLNLAKFTAFVDNKANAITLGVFENNISALECYKSVGFELTDTTENYNIFGENWKCIEMQLKSKGEKYHE